MGADFDVTVLFPIRRAHTYPTLCAALQGFVVQPGVTVQVVAAALQDAGRPALETAVAQIRAVRAYAGSAIEIVDRAQDDGFGAALDLAAQRARGRYCIIGTARTLYTLGAFAALALALDTHPEAGFAYGDVVFGGPAHAADRVVLHFPGPYRREDFMRAFPSLQFYMYRRAALDLGCSYAAASRLSAEGQALDMADRDFVMQLIVNLGWSGLKVETLALHYIGHGEMTGLYLRHIAAMNDLWQARWPMAGPLPELRRAP